MNLKYIISKETEIEYKSLLSKKKYKKLKKHFAKGALGAKTYKQTNYFFDTEDFKLKDAKITLRIRKKEGGWELTLKVPQEKIANQLYNKKEEYNVEISPEEAKKILKSRELQMASNPVFNVLKGTVNLEPSTIFHLLGKLKTKRTDYTYQQDTVSLDKNKYNKRIDYELERETNKTTLPQELKDLGVKIGNAKGKRRRFLLK
ncbi:hypothetical protein CN918_26310 [Priestia megaterium]|nr:hypothetical protein CN918_26310 [Priestia megaterium]